MRKAKYLQLLNSASQISNTLSLDDQQIASLSVKCATTCATMLCTLNPIQDAVQAIDVNSCITTLQLEALHKYKSELEKIAKELNKDLLKPVMQINKQLEEIKQTIDGKITPALAEGCEFDLDLIKQILQRCRPQLESCRQRVNILLSEIQKVQTKIDAVDKSIHRLDLPNDISQATKDVEKATQDLSALSMHMAQLPHGRERFKGEFLPLRAALEKLNAQSLALLTEPVKDEKSIEVAIGVKNKM